MDGKILIVDDVATNRIVFKVKLGAACYHPLMASGGRECLRIAREAQPDLILLDLMLPDLPGVEVLRHLREDPVTRDIPVIVVSASTMLQDRLSALEAGADDVFVKPYDDQLLMARVRNLLRSRQDLADLTKGHEPALLGLADAATEYTHPGVLALVTNRPEQALKLRRDLAPLIRDRIVVMGQSDTLIEVEPGQSGADIYVIEAQDTQADHALRLISDLRSRVATRHAGICLMIGPRLRQDVLMAYDMGANALLTTDMTMAEVALRLRAVLRRKRRADAKRDQLHDDLRLAMSDPLTGLHNRRYASARLPLMAQNALASGQNFAVMIADIDRFKSVNDRFGHAIGDLVLREVSQRLGANLRDEDLLARIGGEEFLIALPATDLDEAQSIAQRLCRLVEHRPVLLPDGTTLPVTISIGLAVSTPPSGVRPTAEDHAGSLLDRADQALLASKNAGRNQVTLGRSAA